MDSHNWTNCIEVCCISFRPKKNPSAFVTLRRSHSVLESLSNAMSNNEIYLGYWVDRDQSSETLGATLTVPVRVAIILASVLTFVIAEVGFPGLWKTIIYII